MKIGKREIRVRSFLVFFYCFTVFYVTYNSVWWVIPFWLCGLGISSHLFGLLAERKKRKYVHYFFLGIIVYLGLTALILKTIEPDMTKKIDSTLVTSKFNLN